MHRSIYVYSLMFGLYITLHSKLYSCEIISIYRLLSQTSSQTMPIVVSEARLLSGLYMVLILLHDEVSQWQASLQLSN